MKSICIKTNNSIEINYLLEKLNNLSLQNFCFSYKKFKHYNNIIVHFSDKNINLFLNKLSTILTYLFFDLYEKSILKKIIFNDYFYFSSEEKNKIYEITLNDLKNKDEAVLHPNKKLALVKSDFYSYLKEHHSIVLIGFITFRLKNYFDILSAQIDKSVNKYIVEKEYNEFINILKLYVNTEHSTCNVLHLIYYGNNPTLLSENKEIIKIDNNIFNKKYLSDITFSDNDYILNTILNLLPKKIYIHLSENSNDEFINTLKLIFENRVIFCSDCDICNIYKLCISTPE